MEGFFSPEEAAFPDFFASLWNVHEGQRSSVGVCVLLHEGLYQPFESRSVCLGGKGVHGSTQSPIKHLYLWFCDLTKTLKIYAHLTVYCGRVELCLLFGCGKQLLGKIFLIMLTFEGK